MNKSTADFAWGAGMLALGLDAPRRFEAVLPEAVQQADLAAKLGGEPPMAALLAWPSRDGGLMICILIGRDGAANDFVVAWPFATSGIAHRMIVRAIHTDEDCDALRLIEGEIAGTTLVAFDSGATFIDAGVDTILEIRLHAWAVRLEPASIEPIRYHADDVNEIVRQAFQDTFEHNDELVLRTDQLVALLPRGDRPTTLYEFRSPVRAVRDGVALPGMKAWTLTVSIARADDGDETLDVELTVTDAVWTGDPPEAGQSVHGLLWLQLATSPL